MRSEVKVKVNCHLPPAGTAYLVSGAFVCEHRQGGWNAVSSDQFGEQTAIKVGKGGFKEITLEQKTVTEWLIASPIVAYEEDQPHEKEVLHNGEGLSRYRLDADNRRRVANELSKHSQQGGSDESARNQAVSASLT